MTRTSTPLGWALPLTADVRRPVARVVRGWTLVLVGVWCVYMSYVLGAHTWVPGADGFFKTYIFSGVLLAAAATCLLRARLIPIDRHIWVVLGIGMAAWGLGSVYWSVFLKHLEAPPYPSGADALYLTFYPAAYVALMLLIRPQLRGIRMSVWLDGLIGVLAGSALAAAFIVPTIATGTGGGTAVVATNLAYPLADVLLFALLVGGFALSNWRPGRTWLLIGAGLLLFSVADVVYLDQVSSGTFVEGTWLDAIWPAGLILLAFAAWQRPGRTATHVASSPILVVPVPLLLTLSSVGILVYGNVATDVNLPSILLAAATVLAGLARLAASLHEVRGLAETRRQATTDELTGLPNRRFFFTRLREELRDTESRGEPLTLLIADLDGFKELNDTLGHQAGDLLLRQLGPRVRDALRAGDTLARLGGDEFAVLLPGMSSKDAVGIIEQIRAIIDRPFAIGDLTIHMEASIGVASSPQHALTADELVQRADVAMYQAKESHAGYEVYAAERDIHSRDRLQLLGGLRRAIDNDELEVHYQPKVDLSTDEVTGVEALVRWRHPERGMVGPMDFIPLAERTTLMRPLTLHILDRTLEQCRRWNDAGHHLTVAVNLSVANILDSRLADDVDRLLRRWRISPEQLNLEVTENVILADPVRVIEVLEALKRVGVSLSLDDFGTGASSLSYLRSLPIDELKIDRSFVMNIETSPTDEIIVRSTTELAQRLGLRVVAEGVETAAAMEQLVRTGCEEAQGYFVQRPVPAAELDVWMAARAVRVAPT